jgi:hypothetical protein
LAVAFWRASDWRSIIILIDRFTPYSYQTHTITPNNTLLSTPSPRLSAIKLIAEYLQPIANPSSRAQQLPSTTLASDTRFT